MAEEEELSPKKAPRLDNARYEELLLKEFPDKNEKISLFEKDDYVMWGSLLVMLVLLFLCIPLIFFFPVGIFWLGSLLFLMVFGMGFYMGEAIVRGPTLKRKDNPGWFWFFQIFFLSMALFLAVVPFIIWGAS